MAKKLKLYFDDQLAKDLAGLLAEQLTGFNNNSFAKQIISQIDDFELKDRVKIFGKALYEFIPGSYKEKLEVLQSIMGPENPNSYGTFMEYFWLWTFSSVVEQYGVEERDASLSFIYELTKRATGEFAIRQFIEQDPKATVRLMQKWSRDKNFHVRRLSTEGLRPLLPWAPKLKVFVDNPDPVFVILERLKTDPEKYVHTSVANHIGDYLKVNYDYTMDVLKFWVKSDSDITKWVIKHGTRNLRKKEDQGVMELVSLL